LTKFTSIYTMDFDFDFDFVGSPTSAYMRSYNADSTPGNDSEVSTPPVVSTTSEPVTWSEALQQQGELRGSEMPKVGGLGLQDGVPTVFVGAAGAITKLNQFSLKSDALTGKDPTDWECRTFQSEWGLIQGAVFPGQYRPITADGPLKVAAYSKTYVGTTFTGLDNEENQNRISVRTYRDTIEKHLVETGMWEVFQVPNPADKTQKRSLLRKQVPSRHVRAWIDHFSQTADKWALDNLAWSGEYLLDSLSGPLLDKVINDVGINGSGPVVLASIMDIIYSGAGPEALEGAKKFIEATQLKDMPNEDVSVLNDRLQDQFDFLESVDCLEVGSDLLVKLSSKYISGSNEKFRVWAISYNRSVEQFVDQCKTCDPSSLPTHYTFDMIMSDSTAEYRTLVDSDCWSTTATSKTDGYSIPDEIQATIDDLTVEASLPAGYQAAIENLTVASLPAGKQTAIENQTVEASLPAGSQATIDKQTVEGSLPAGDQAAIENQVTDDGCQGGGTDSGRGYQYSTPSDLFDDIQM